GAVTGVRLNHSAANGCCKSSGWSEGEGGWLGASERASSRFDLNRSPGSWDRKEDLCKLTKAELSTPSTWTPMADLSLWGRHRNFLIGPSPIACSLSTHVPGPRSSDDIFPSTRGQLCGSLVVGILHIRPNGRLKSMSSDFLEVGNARTDNSDDP